MTKHIKLQKDYTQNSDGYQLKLPWKIIFIVCQFFKINVHMRLECIIQILILRQSLQRRFEKHPEIKNNSLFAYTLVLLKRLPDESSKKFLIQTVETVLSEYRDDIDLNLIGFPDNYLEIMRNNL